MRHSTHYPCAQLIVICRPVSTFQIRGTLSLGSSDAVTRRLPSALKSMLDAAAFERYLAARIAGFRGPIGVRRFRGGQSNPTYLLDTTGKRYVLRRKPAGELLPSANLVEREYQVMTALAGTGGLSALLADGRARCSLAGDPKPP